MKSLITGIISILLAVNGVYYLMKAPSLGSSAADKYVADAGGHMDAGAFVAILQGYEYTYMILGAILLFIGLLTLAAVTLMQINKSE